MSSPSVAGEHPAWASNCEVCQRLWKRFIKPDFFDEINFGSPEKALSTQCPTHKPLVQSFIDFIDYIHGSGQIDPAWERPPSEDIGISKGWDGRQGSVRIYESITQLGYNWGLVLAQNNSIPNHPGTGRVLDPDWIDMDVLRQWKQKCLSSHGEQCENPLKLPPIRPAWMIDVNEKCLVSGKNPGSFVALSYGHERCSEKVVDANTLAILQGRGSLDDPGMSEFVTPIIQQAIYLTSAIGERYLWVDMLCITHQTPEDAADQIGKMGEIFSSAVVAIIAADSYEHEDDDDEDRNTGTISDLRGIKGVSKPRVLNQKVIPFGDEKLVVRNTDIFSLGGGTPYFENGWTYQQFEMARRRIIFRSGEIHWQCHCSVWHEELVKDVEVDKYINPRLRVVAAGFPDLQSLSHGFSKYNETTLENDDEVLQAISSIMSLASRTFEGGFLYGIPEIFFENGLTWRPYWDHTNLRRRILSTGPSDEPSTQHQIPSWSWMGWQGMVLAGHGEAARINDRESHIQETVPTTEWYTGSSPTDTPSQRRRIRSTWYENRESNKDFTRPMPPGWTRHEAPATGTFRGEPSLYPDGCGKYIFKHPALPEPDSDVQGWYFPFPVIDTQSTPPFMPEQTRFLFCETSQASVIGYKSDKGKYPDMGVPFNVAQLFNSSGEKIGTLDLNNSDSLALFPDFPIEGQETTSGLLVDLVVICKTRIYSKTWVEEKSMYDHPISKSDRYKVLWVEWKDGIAYRLASGHVNVAYWDKLESKPVSLVLG